MPFKSKNQARAAFGGYLGPEMKAKAKTWADETPNMKSLPSHVGGNVSKMWDKKDKRMESKSQMRSEGEMPKKGKKMSNLMSSRMKSKGQYDPSQG